MTVKKPHLTPKPNWCCCLEHTPRTLHKAIRRRLTRTSPKCNSASRRRDSCDWSAWSPRTFCSAFPIWMYCLHEYYIHVGNVFLLYVHDFQLLFWRRNCRPTKTHLHEKIHTHDDVRNVRSLRRTLCVNQPLLATLMIKWKNSHCELTSIRCTTTVQTNYSSSYVITI